MKQRSKYKFLVLSLAIFLTVQKNITAQSVTVEAKLDTNQIFIGDQVNFNILVKKNKDVAVKFPAFNGNLTDEVEIISKSPIDSNWLREEKKVILKQKLVVTVFDSGLYYIPPLNFLISTQDHSDTIHTAATYLEVFSFPLDTTGTIREIKSVYKAPLSFNEAYPYFLGLLFLGLLTWGIIYYYQKKKKNEPILKKIKPKEPAHVIAIRELDKLKAEKIWQRKQVKLYYSRLTEIIRMYIEQRFEIPAMEQTTDEILVEFEEQKMAEKESYTLLKDMLQQADLVKFAKADPLPDENDMHLENAFKFVMSTKFQPTEQQVQEIEPVGN